MGINLTAPTRLLHRPQAIQQTVELTSPDDQADTLIRFSPDEPMRFRFQPFALVEEPAGITRLLAIEQSSGAGAPGKICQLLLHPSDFAIDFITIEVVPQMLTLTRIRLRLEIGRMGRERDNGGRRSGPDCAGVAAKYVTTRGTR